MTALPPSIAEIAEVIGRDRALYLIGQLPQRGGRSWRSYFYVPQRIKSPDHWMVELIGQRDADLMVAAFGGLILQVANGRAIYRRYRDEQIRQSIEEGVSAEHLAEIFDLSTYRVREIANGKPPEG